MRQLSSGKSAYEACPARVYAGHFNLLVEICELLGLLLHFTIRLPQRIRQVVMRVDACLENVTILPIRKHDLEAINWHTTL